MTRRPIFAALLTAAIAFPLAACEARKSSTPLSPSVAGPIAGVEITAPRLLEPANGTKIKESQQPITLLVENSSSNGVRPVAYIFEVATDATFGTKMYARSGVLPGSDGRTRVTVDRLESGRTYHWRVRADDGANASSFSTSSFELLPKPQLDPPPQHSPINSAQVTSRRPALTVGVSARNVAVGNVVYEFQLASNSAMTNMVAAGQRSEAGATTSFAPDGDLNYGTLYFWRVKALDGETESAWSPIHGFMTPGAPSPSPSPSPGPSNPGGPCNSSNPQTIVECERARYGFMDRGQLLEFVRNVARSLNRNGISGGPYGILRKASGNQCGGYSCDIICAGQGTSQRQHDVLSDIEGTQGAGWGAAHTWPNIRVDVCEIQ